jgi:hypothetical protein
MWLIIGRVVAPAADGWESSGRDVPMFTVGGNGTGVVSDEGAARHAVAVMSAAGLRDGDYTYHVTVTDLSRDEKPISSWIGRAGDNSHITVTRRRRIVTVYPEHLL